MKPHNKFARAVALALSCCMIHATARAQAPVGGTVTVNIDSQPMDRALNTFAQQTGLQLLMRADAVTAGITAPRLVGTYTAQDALDRLLARTELSYKFIDARTVAIRAEKSKMEEGSSTSDSAAQQLVDAPRLAQSNDPASLMQDVESEKGAFPAYADAAKANVEEIVVTAQKRAENLREVPISISVLRGIDLDKSNAKGVTELLNSVPGVSTFTTFQGGGTNITVRGVSAGGALFNGSSAVAYYLDSVPFGFVKSAIAPDANAYDLARVEVLRGPQGTLYGASSLNGVVRVLTQDADLEKFDFKARSSYSATDDGGDNYRGDFAVNVPIVEGKLAARAVFGYQDLSGWIEKPNLSNANDSKITTTRLKIGAQPSERASIGFSAWLSRTDDGAPSTARDDGRQSNTLDESISTDYNALGLKVGYDFSMASLSSMTSYLDYKNTGSLDTSWLGLPLAPLYTRLDSEVLAQELVINSTNTGAWRWSTGGMYRDAKDLLVQTFGPYLAAPTDVTDHSKSLAVFGEVTRRFSEGTFEVTAGLRYFRDDVKNIENVQHTGDPTQVLERENETFEAVSPRVVLTWRPRDQLNLYASYAEGFRSGFHQYPQVTSATPEFPPLDPDTLKNYELGAKADFLGGRVQFESAVYFMDWKDVQQSRIIYVPNGAPFTAMINGEAASGLGVDVGLTARPADGLTIGITGSWNQLEMDEDVIVGGAVFFEQGDRLGSSPEYTFGASADYSFGLGRSGYSGRASTTISHNAPFNTATRGIARPSSSDALTMARASFSIDAPSHWTATLFGDNLTDERGTLDASPLGNDWSARWRPRTFGLQLEYRF